MECVQRHAGRKGPVSCCYFGGDLIIVFIMYDGWNPWHGCHKISAGCLNCYVYRRDTSIGKDASVVSKTQDYDLPLKRDRKGNSKLRPGDGTVFTCMTSDFFLEEADAAEG